MRIATTSPYSNWTGSDTTYPEVVVIPESEADLVAIVRNNYPGVNFPSPVRAAGHLHSTNPCFSTSGIGTTTTGRCGTLVLMRPMRPDSETVSFGAVNILRPQPGQPDVYVRAGAGARMIDIREALRGEDPNGRPWNRELAVSPEIGSATAGSVACGGTKDSTLQPWNTPNQSQISSLVVEVKYVNANGDRIRLYDGGYQVLGPNGTVLRVPTLAEFRSSYGLFGIVYEVTFKTAPRIRLRTRYQWLPFPNSPTPRPQDIPDLHRDVFDHADAVLGFLQPYDGGMLVERRTRTEDQPAPGDDLRRAIRDWMWEFGASQAVTVAAELANLGADPQRAFTNLLTVAIESALTSTSDNPVKDALGVTGGLSEDQVLVEAGRMFAILGVNPGVVPGVPPLPFSLPPLPGGLGASTALRNTFFALFHRVPGPFFSALGGFVGHRSDSMIAFESRSNPMTASGSRTTCFDFTFWMFPLTPETWRETVSGYFAFCHKHRQQNDDFRASLFTEVYFMGEDTTSVLSPCPNGPAFTLDTVDSRPGDAGWRRFNEAYNEWAAKNGGRPLLNQTKHLESTPNVKMKVLDKAYQANQGNQVDWAAFSSLVRAADPHRRFLSDFFEQLLH